uniref:short transient receptor potential channel 4-like isoform X2 n=1 Tax=Ciona intestinalis TaxID=7719 RepID=UPI000EF47EB3|nr:short transient receptor potential channel 4-like isoform X2 [Ciona intestinalis]|eukprot:XP_026692029.1 short transient receptor potential channel 4-like isoform X2 [Ciona intestinalis]
MSRVALNKPYMVETSWRKRSVVPVNDSSDGSSEEDVTSPKNKRSLRDKSNSSTSSFEQESQGSFSGGHNFFENVSQIVGKLRTSSSSFNRKRKSSKSRRPKAEVVFQSPIKVQKKISVFKEEVYDLGFRARAETLSTGVSEFRRSKAQVPFTIQLPNEKKHEKVPKVSKSSIIKAGWTVRRALAVLSPPATCNSFYLETVAKGHILEVKVLFDLFSRKSLKDFERDVVDQNERSALRIAVENKDTNMCELLLKNKSSQVEGKYYMKMSSVKINHQIFQGMSSPAYITLICELKKYDPMEYCIEHIKDLRKQSDKSYECMDFYKKLEDKTEEYMCSLLDQIRNSDELAKLMRYNYDELIAIKDQNESLSELSNKIELLDTAVKNRLVKVVNHHYSQLSLVYLKNQHSSFQTDSRLKLLIRRSLLAITFPILCLFYLFAPNTRIGKLMMSPLVLFDCHMASDIMFIGIIFLNTVTKTVQSNYLGSPPTVLEWIALSWIIGKWAQEIEECLNRGWRCYLGDGWNHTDLLALILLTVAIIFRYADCARHSFFIHSHRNNTLLSNDPFEPRKVADALLALAYVFVFLKLLSLSRASRTLGPLQVTLARMMADVSHFLFIFFLVIFAFALGLNELYWVYGTEEGKKSLCSFVGNNTMSESCLKSAGLFSNMWTSLQTLFWSLFGQFNIDDLTLPFQNSFTETVGRTLIAVYHAVAIIVILNMLIAMMSRSYEITSENEEREWKFHRTEMWIRFIRREASRPPPMNLIPNPWGVYKAARQVLRKCLSKCPCSMLRDCLSDTEAALNEKTTEEGWKEIKCKLIKTKLIKRYKFNVLLADNTRSF